ncbi:MAG: hypothetical protein LBR13_02580 [Dysgonamonadaceae bacterium]|jgi:hypothetical protein|nr:hypothetical protein [Dysgonamonadaceae bacterium]
MEENYLNEKPLENGAYNEPQISVPNAVAVLILGILSIPFCCVFYGSGLILAIIALVLASKGTSAYIADPQKYTEGSYKNLKAGKICAWIGLILSIVYIAIIVAMGIKYGWDIFQIKDPAVLLERFGLDPSQYGY